MTNNEPSANDHPPAWQLNCPVPLEPDGERISLAHGEGGRLMRKLIRERIMSRLGGRGPQSLDDAARLPAITGQLAMTTDSFVVAPLFFPGGDIGSLAVYGTVNDLAVSGAKPLYLTLSLIIEEGLPLAVLDRILRSLADAAARAEVQVVAGDTKVVPRGAADGLFINTAGVGELLEPVPPGPASLQEGDVLIVTGPIGRHGIAVLCAREELGLEPPPQSDSAPLVHTARLLREALGPDLRAMRDATRGGVAGVLHEWAEASGRTLTIRDQGVPVSPDVRGACELLGLDPLHVANEGTMVIAVAGDAAQPALDALRGSRDSRSAAAIGHVVDKRIAPVTVLRRLGAEQPLVDPLGAPLPRIC